MSIPFGVPFFKRSVVGTLGVDAFGDGSGIGFYTLNDTKIDLGTNGLLLSGSSTYNVVKFGNGLTLNGSQTASVTATAYGNLVPWYNAMSVRLSLSFWFKATTTNKRNILLYNEKWGGNIELGSDNKIAFGGHPNFLFTSTTYSTNSINHVVVSFIDGVCYAYVNNVFIGSVSVLSSGGTGIMCLGHGSVGLTGSIDHLRIFNRQLTQAEVTALYNEVG